jgi:hypothetical protein
LEACISLDGSLSEINYREVSKTGNSYTFNLTEAERNILLDNTLSGISSRYVYFYLRTTIGSTVLHNYSRKVFTVSNAAPVVSCVAKDTNPDTVALTGNSNRLIKGHSNIGYTITATPQKRASITGYRFAVEGSQTSLAAADTIFGVISNNVSYSASDNRGYNITGNPSFEFVDYVDISCSQSVVSELSGETGSTIRVSVEGNYYNGSFGNVNNELYIDVQYMDVEDGTIQGTVRLTEAYTPIFSNGKYSLTATLPMEFDYSHPISIKTIVSDKLTRAETDYYITSLIPVFDWSKSDFRFNVPVDFKKGVVFAGNPMVDMIIEQGTSGGWTYRKWKSGYAECWRRLQITTAVNKTWGSLYTSGSLDSTNLSYPFEFMDVPTLNVSLMPFGYGGIIMATGDGYGNIIETGPFEIARGTSLSSGQFLLAYHAFGRWDI